MLHVNKNKIEVKIELNKKYFKMALLKKKEVSEVPDIKSKKDKMVKSSAEKKTTNKSFEDTKVFNDNTEKSKIIKVIEKDLFISEIQIKKK